MLEILLFRELAWAVTLGFVRLTTNRRVFASPLTIAAACKAVRWTSQANVSLVDPGSNHLATVERLLGEAGVGGNPQNVWVMERVAAGNSLKEQVDCT